MYLLNQPRLIVRYLALSVWPDSLVLDYGLPQSFSLGEVIPFAVIVLALLFATCLIWRWSRPLAFLGTWFFVTLAPASSLIPIATEAGAERRMYLPLAAVVVLAVTTIYQGTRAAGTQWSRRLAVLALVATGAVLSALTVRRNAEYRDPLVLWQTVVDRRPQPRAHCSLGLELLKAGRRLEAVEQLEMASVGYPKARYALGVLHEQEGRHADAVHDLREYVRARPDDADVIPALNLVGRALTEDGQLDEATATFHQVLEMLPGNDEARVGLAGTFTKVGLSFVARDRAPEAAEAFAKAVALDPRDPAKQENLGHALAALARLDEAEVHYRQALALAPTKATLHSALGAVLLAQGKKSEAMACFQRALELGPADDQVRMDVAAALRRLGTRIS